MKIRFIINPISGGGKHKNILDLLEKNIDAKRFDYDYLFTERSKHATELSKKAADEKSPTIS